VANQFARAMRRNQTDPEYLLWRELRQLRHEGLHFRRQAPIDDYIVDFVCYSARLEIEVDGSQQDTPEGIRKDVARDAHLKYQGFDILRFSNADVSWKLNGVMMEVLAALGLVRPPAAE
jgi:very-short-patch-repair endonuclease